MCEFSCLELNAHSPRGFVLVAILLLYGLEAAEIGAAEEQPNFVVIFTDDQGYQDVGCFGSPNIKTPNLDRMAAEGMKFTDFHVAAPSCTPSRAALITGCYPMRVSLPRVLFPQDTIGINADEFTIAEMLKSQNYATACFGKWHLGHLPEFLPTRHGFDTYFGLPYSNDMWPFHSRIPGMPDLPLIDQETAIAHNPDQTQLTSWYTERAIQFIERHQDGPFFVYLPHSLPHVPLYVSDKFDGKSERGLYGDVIMEIDWSVGQIVSTLKKLGIDERTLMLFTSDNGPWLAYGLEGGSALPLRDGKGTTWEGGMREPCIMRWPGKIPPGTVCDELCSTMDLLPTFARLADAELPTDRAIDGHDIWPLMSGEKGAFSPYEAFYYYAGPRLEAVRDRRWKLVFERTYSWRRQREGRPVDVHVPLSLYDLKSDIRESRNVLEQHPDIVRRLQEKAAQMRGDLGDSLTDRPAKNSRPPGRT